MLVIFPASRFPCCVLSYFSLVFVMEHNWQIQVKRVNWVGQSTRFYWNAWPYQRSKGIVDQLFHLFTLQTLSSVKNHDKRIIFMPQATKQWSWLVTNDKSSGREGWKTIIRRPTNQWSLLSSWRYLYIVEQQQHAMVILRLRGITIIRRLTNHCLSLLLSTTITPTK